MNVRAIIGEADNGWVVEVPGTVRMIPGHEPQVLSEQATRVAHNGTELVAVIRDLLGLAEGPQVPVVFDEVFMADPCDAEWQALIERAQMRASETMDRLFGDIIVPISHEGARCLGCGLTGPEGGRCIGCEEQQEARPLWKEPGEWLVF